MVWWSRGLKVALCPSRVRNTLFLEICQAVCGATTARFYLLLKIMFLSEPYDVTLEVASSVPVSDSPIILSGMTATSLESIVHSLIAPQINTERLNVTKEP